MRHMSDQRLGEGSAHNSPRNADVYSPVIQKSPQHSPKQSRFANHPKDLIVFGDQYSSLQRGRQMMKNRHKSTIHTTAEMILS